MSKRARGPGHGPHSGPGGFPCRGVGTLEPVSKPLNGPRLLAVSLGAAAIAGFCQARFGTGWLESAGFFTGVVGVYLAAEEHLANYPVGIVNVLLYSVFFFQGRMFGDAALQLVFFAFLVHGWISWTRRDSSEETLSVGRLTFRQSLTAAAVVVAGTAALYPLLLHVEGKSPLVDGFTTSGSLVAQFLLNRKRIENWVLWIVVDLVYLPWYVKLGYYPTAILYAIFLGLAVLGFLSWRQTLSSRLTGEGEAAT